MINRMIKRGWYVEFTTDSSYAYNTIGPEEFEWSYESSKDTPFERLSEMYSLWCNDGHFT
jgi:hypothetical protein